MTINRDTSLTPENIERIARVWGGEDFDVRRSLYTSGAVEAILEARKIDAGNVQELTDRIEKLDKIVDGHFKLYWKLATEIEVLTAALGTKDE